MSPTRSKAGLIALQDLCLADGRRLSFSTIGPANGYPFLYMHGAIGSPLRSSPQLDAAVTSLGLRYVMVNRPGFGGSDPHPGRRVIDFAADVEELAVALGLRRFSIVGVSAGAPYALACARRMPERIAVATLVSALSQRRPLHLNPGTRARYRLPLLGLATAPRLSASLANTAAGLLRCRPALGLRLMMLGAAEADRRLLAVPEARAALAESFAFAIRAGAEAMIEDYLVCSAPWGFETSEVTANVRVWHGEDDRLVPVQEAQRLACELPHGELRVLRAGHYLFQRRLFQIVGEMQDPHSAAA